ncbi:isopenicillin N synthase family dioxygenase [Azospirillum sp. sgz302134]
MAVPSLPATGLPATNLPASSLPVIDVTGLTSPDLADRLAIGRQIAEACGTTGFFYIRNHGVPQAIIDTALAKAKTFFRLPAEEKAKVAADARFRGYHAADGALMYGATKPDFKEFFQMGLDLPETDPDVVAGQPLRGPNRWPENPPGFRPAMEAYYRATGACGARLLRGVALALGLPEDFFDDRYAKPMQRTQAIYYPPQPADMGEEQFGVAPHTDYGCITLLYQDDAGGLEAQRLDGAWVAAPPVPGTFVVNVGDLLDRWSNGRFKSTPHRVVNRSGRERMSIATFYDPTYTTVVDSRELLAALNLEEAPKHPPIQAGDHIQNRIAESGRHRRRMQEEAAARSGAPSGNLPA